MYLVGSIPLLVYRQDTASRCVTHFYRGRLMNFGTRRKGVGSFAACKCNDRSGKSVYFILRTNMLL